MIDLFDDPTLARLYDLETGAYDADLAFYRRHLRRRRGPVLEMGAGAGRVAIGLARAGFAVTGVERSAVMLALARERVAALPPRVADRVTLLRGDVARRRPIRGHQAAISAFNSLLHVSDPRDQRRALRFARGSLTSGGLLLLEVGSPWAEILDPHAERLRHVYTHESEAGSVTLWEIRRTDLARQTTVTHLFYDLTDERGAMTRRTATLTQRWLFRDELLLLLELTGFRPRAIHGDYDESGPPADPFGKMLVVAEAR